MNYVVNFHTQQTVKIVLLVRNRNEACYFCTMLVCGLCNRPIPSDAPQSVHHLIPRSKGGKNGPTVTLHHLCHKEIHITLSETELARTYNNLESLRTHPRLAKFISWVKKRPPEFLSRSRVRKKK